MRHHAVSLPILETKKDNHGFAKTIGVQEQCHRSVAEGQIYPLHVLETVTGASAKKASVSGLKPV